MSLLDLSKINTQGGTQTRAALDNAVVTEYANALRDGVKLPAVTVFFDGSTYWLADGFHRFFAPKEARKGGISVDIRQGTKRDAVLFSTGANATHGLRRTNEDKRRAVNTLLEDAEWSQWSDREIAKQCDVSHTFVANLRTAAVATLPVQKAGKVATLQPEERAEGGNVATHEPEQDEHEQQLNEAAHTIADLSAEVESLKAQVAVGGLPAAEQESAAEIIADLRAQVKSLEAELAAVKVSRDGFQRENRELHKQISMNTKELKKLRTAVPA